MRTAVGRWGSDDSTCSFRIRDPLPFAIFDELLFSKNFWERVTALQAQLAHLRSKNRERLLSS